MEIFWIFLVLAIVVGVVAAVNNEKAKQRAKQAYQDSLRSLKADPTNSDLRQRTLALGRAYSNLMRDKKGNSVFDEVALMNDINAACAAGHQFVQSQSEGLAESSDSVESRLQKLQALKEAGLIDDEDFAHRKREIVSLI